MSNGDGVECDFSMLLSQELIAKVMQDYLNKVMLRQQVVVVDLQNTEAGYVFSLRQMPKMKVVKAAPTNLGERLSQALQSVPEVQYDVYVGGTGAAATQHVKVGRAKNGRFTPTPPHTSSKAEVS